LAGTGKQVAVTSPTFGFLAAHEPLLVRYAASAEHFFVQDPNTALIKLRQFAELVVKEAAFGPSVSKPWPTKQPKRSGAGGDC
jgi:hypothetical protein